MLLKSFVYMSDELSHNSTSVFLILKKILPELPPLVSPLKCIHYWTDNPTTQYRNKTIFSLIANHKSAFGFSAVWNHFEAAHGKGPSDGVGGTAKRMADETVKQAKSKSKMLSTSRLGKKEWKQQLGELQILLIRWVLWRRQVPWKKMQKCQSRSKHDGNSLCFRHFSGAC